MTLEGENFCSLHRRVAKSEEWTATDLVLEGKVVYDTKTGLERFFRPLFSALHNVFDGSLLDPTTFLSLWENT